MLGLSNRETAAAIWLLLFLAWVLSRPKIRSPMIRALRLLCGPKLGVPILLTGLMTAGFVYVLYQMGWWTFSELKDTIIWFFLSGISMLFVGLSDKEPVAAVRRSLRDALKIVVIVEFLLNAYTFSLLAELLLLPALALFAMLQVVSESQEQYAVVASFLKWVQGLISLALILFVAWSFYNQPGEVWSKTGLRAFMLPILLAIMYTPLAYFMALLSAYEQLLLPLKVGDHKPRKIVRHAKVKALMMFRLNLRKVTQARKRMGFELAHAKTITDIDVAFSNLRAATAF